MGAPVTTAQVWMELERQIFGVVGLVTAKGESRTAGIVYLVRDKKVYFSTDANTWKIKHLHNNPNISMTVPIAKRFLLLPWLKIPAATISFSGIARILDLAEVSSDIPDKLLKDLEPAEELRQHMCVIEITPKGNFITYGVGVPIKTMLKPMEAGGIIPVE